MSDGPRGYYQSIPIMDGTIVPGSKFFVEVAGTTREAQKEIVYHIEKCGYTRVLSPEQSDFLLIFCPVVSRVGTDIGEALQNVTQFNKPKVLVVMHHTFNGRMAVAESRRQVEDGSVVLTVDCLFYEGKLLTCDRNDIAWGQICRYLGIPTDQPSFFTSLKNNIRNNPFKVLLYSGIVGIGIVIVWIICHYAINEEAGKNVSSKHPLK